MTSKKINNKINKKQFTFFKERVQFYSNLFGITDWKIFLDKEDLGEECKAKVYTNYKTRGAKVVLNETVDEKTSNASLESTAMHEVIHIVLADLLGLGTERFCSEDEIYRIEEATVRRLTIAFESLNKSNVGLIEDIS